ncbi:MAG TPA: hypothetical protein VMI94_21425 [Bryobacteraceae bacterium]|nr:hypothetical protein [Bryobacteraceae bacterium]
MTDGSAATLTANYSPEAVRSPLLLRLKSIPWTRILVDALLALGFLFASSSLLTVR